MHKTNGMIVKSVRGFYFVETSDGIYKCNAKGIFRNKDIVPLVGDYVAVQINNTGEGIITEIGARKTVLTRPPVANIDQLFIITSAIDPVPNYLIIDKMIVIAYNSGITPVIIITKSDLSEAQAQQIYDVYNGCGYEVFVFSCINKTEDITKIKEKMKDRISAFTGNTGVGKSTLLNFINSGLNLKTGETSKKLGRGRHTTREVELFALDNGGYVADTPGFSMIDMQRYDIVLKDQLQFCYNEFEPYIGKCRFADCSHISEKGCAIVEALENGEISQIRHDNYVTLYREAEKIKEWEI